MNITECKPIEPSEGYTLEKSQLNDKEYTLFFGRGDYSHGLNLCKISDFDHQGEETRKKILDALNGQLFECQACHIHGTEYMKKIPVCEHCAEVAHKKTLEG